MDDQLKLDFLQYILQVIHVVSGLRSLVSFSLDLSYILSGSFTIFHVIILAIGGSDRTRQSSHTAYALLALYTDLVDQTSLRCRGVTEEDFFVRF